MRKLAAIGLLATFLVGCSSTVPGGKKVTTPTPETVIGKLPTLGPKGNAGARPPGLHLERLRRLPHLPAGRHHGEGRPEPEQPRRLGAEGEPGHARPVHPRLDRRSGRVRRSGLPRRRDAGDLRADAEPATAGRPGRVPGPGTLRLPPDFPRDVRVVATDLDQTLIAKDYVLRPRTLAAIARTEAAGVRVIVCTGRMVQSARRVLEPAQLGEPLVCYQGAAIVSPDGTWLRHEPIAVALAKEAIAAVEAAGYGLNVYVDDELYVAQVTPEAQRYSDFQGIPLHTVGDLVELARAAADEARRDRRPGRARRPRRPAARAVRGPALGDEVASVLPRARRRRGLEVALRSSTWASTPRAPSRSATARTTSTSSPGATESRSRTPTPA